MKQIKLNQPKISRSTRRQVSRVLKSGQLTQGKEVTAFENEFSNLVDGKPCVAVNSGTSGLITALMALNIGYGDEVIVPSFTFAASANAIKIVGAHPRFVDINPATYCLDEAKLELLINDKTKAIMVVHMFGLPANMEKVIRLAIKYKLFIIEDAAQAHLARIGNNAVGTFGDVAVFSFYPTKNMTTAEGGMVVFRENQTARRGKLLRNQGMEERYKNEIIGFNFRMSEVHSVIGRAQLKKIASWTEKRIENANFLSSLLEFNDPPVIPNGYRHVFHQYTIRICKDRNKVIEFLNSRSIQCGVFYPTPVHKLDSFKIPLTLPETEKACAEVLSLPVHPHLSRRQIIRIASDLNLIQSLNSNK